MITRKELGYIMHQLVSFTPATFAAGVLGGVTGLYYQYVSIPKCYAKIPQLNQQWNFSADVLTQTCNEGSNLSEWVLVLSALLLILTGAIPLLSYILNQKGEEGKR